MTSTSGEGNKFWYKHNSKRHITDGLVEYVNGDKEWFQNGIRHRDDGPAIEHANGDKFWFQNGIRHRDDGPAIEYANGDVEWYINGTQLTQAEFAAEILDNETATLWKMSGYCWPFDFRLNK
jgi:hypothetical protein